MRIVAEEVPFTVFCWRCNSVSPLAHAAPRRARLMRDPGPEVHCAGGLTLRRAHSRVFSRPEGT